MAASRAIGWLKSNFTMRSFGLSLITGLMIYSLFFGWLWLNSATLQQQQQQRLESRTVLITQSDQPALPADIPQTADLLNGAADETAPVDALPDEPLQPRASEQAMAFAEAKTLESGLNEAPIDGLYADEPDGRLPVIRNRDGLTPFTAYKRPFDSAAHTGKPLIAIAIMDFGLSDIAAQAALANMPADVSFILSPYAEMIAFWTTEARSRGHEIWLTLPVESELYPLSDSGPHTLLVGAQEREHLQKLNWLLGRTVGYVGFVASPQPRFMAAANDVRLVIGNIYNRGLGFFDSSETPGPVPQSMAAGRKAPYGYIDLWLDETAGEQHILAQLRALERLAQEKGWATGVMQPLPISYEVFLKWAAEAEQRGFVLAPLSALTGR